MWPVYLVITWFVLALVVPVSLASWHVWRRARTARRVPCPLIGAPAVVTLDPWYAVRRHALGDPELRVIGCDCWPERRDCGRECLRKARLAA